MKRCICLFSLNLNSSRSHTAFNRGFWINVNTQREALEKIGREQFGVQNLDDWYSVTSHDAQKALNFIANHYNGSLFNTLQSLYPQHHWDKKLFKQLPRGYWSDENVQRDALGKCGREHFGVQELDDWYSISSTEVTNKLSFIGTYYNNSLFKALKTLYPHHDWDPLRFSTVPKRYWCDETAQRNALERFGREKLGVKKLDDWHSVSSGAVKELSFITNYYNGSLFNALKTLYPQHNWDPLKLSTYPPRGYWNDLNVQRDTLERFGRELGVKRLDDWYHVSSLKLLDFRKFRFVQYKHGTLYRALQKLYPHHKWNPVLFVRTPSRYWQSADNVQFYRELFAEWKSKYNLQTASDWHLLDPNQFKLVNRVATRLFGSIPKMLAAWFPDITDKFSSQITLRVSLYYFVMFLTYQQKILQGVVEK